MPRDCMDIFGRFRLIIAFFVMLATAGCDQAVKHLARNSLSEGHPITYANGVVQFMLAQNPGAFLSIGETLPLAVRHVVNLLILAGLLGVIVSVISSKKVSSIQFLGILLACGGALGNIIDRFSATGTVTDFMILRFGRLRTGIFNVADVAVLAGIFIFLCAKLVGRRSGQPALSA